MTLHTDPHGYYAALGVKTDASSERIKKSYRQLAKLYHPDRNKAPTAKAQFQKIKEAYDILSKPEKRSAYDFAAMASPPPPPPPQPPSSSAFTASPHRAFAEVTVPPLLMACSICGAITAQPRKATFWTVYGLLLTTHRYATKGIFCRSCADRQALKCSLKTWIFGWWAFPRGPFYTLDALLRNMMGGDQDPDENARLLSQQAIAFSAQKKWILAQASLAQALRLVRQPLLKTDLLNLQQVLGLRSNKRVVDRWHPSATRAFYIQLVPLLSLVVCIAYGLMHPLLNVIQSGIPGSEITNSINPSHFEINQIMYVAAPSTAVQAGPSPLYSTLAYIPQFTSVRIARLGQTDGYVFVRINEQNFGYVALRELKPGDGEAAWRQWCSKTILQPQEQPVLLLRNNISGSQSVEIYNDLSQPIILKLSENIGQNDLVIYLTSQAKEQLSLIPQNYKIQFMTGDDFSVSCGTFTKNMHAYTLKNMLNLDEKLTNSSDVLEEKIIVSEDWLDKNAHISIEPKSFLRGE